MKRILFLLMLTLPPLQAVGTGISLLSVIPLDSSGYPSEGIGKYTPVVAEGNIVYAMDGHLGVKVKVLSEAYPILNIDYLRDTNKILYTYGTGDGAPVAVFDMAEREKYRLDDLTKSDAGQLYYYRIFQEVRWINKDSIVYSVIDPSTHETQIGIYDIAKKKRTLLVQRPKAAIADYNRQEELLAYFWPEGKGASEFRLIDLKDRSELSLGVLPYRSMIIVSRTCYLGLSKVQDSRYESHYQLDLVNNGAVKYSDKTSNIIQPIAYLSTEGLLIAYFAKDRVLSENAVGVFRVSLAP